MDENTSKEHPSVKDLYRLLVETRNFEVNLFWQRCNYFLVLNTAIAVAYFGRGGTDHARLFRIGLAALGCAASLLWVAVSLGGKFWQARWEQQLLEFEREHMPDLDFFAASPDRVKVYAKRGLLDFHKLGRLHKCVYRYSLRKFSVSFSMILLAMLFTIVWVFFGFLAAIE